MRGHLCVSVCKCCSWELESQFGLVGQLDLQVLCQLVQELEGVQVVTACHAAETGAGVKVGVCVL